MSNLNDILITSTTTFAVCILWDVPMLFRFLIAALLLFAALREARRMSKSNAK